MRIESSVTSVSWIPSEVIEDLEALFAAERFRFANHLAAWVEVADGTVVDAGYSGRGYISRTRVGGRHGIVFHPAAFPEIRHQPQVSATGARFVRTTGGRTGMPMPRPVSGSPHMEWVSPTVWTTLTLTIGADGAAAGELTGASRFPRHWCTITRAS